jgi:hypothetical protein
MKIQVLIILIEVVLIILALAVYLIATIIQLFKINAGLDVVLPAVGEIGAKTAPINGVLGGIVTNLVMARDALEGLHLKKAGPDAAGLVESLFPGEGANFLRRVGRSGKVVNVGTVYTRGVGILETLGRGAPALTRGERPRDATGRSVAAAPPAAQRSESEGGNRPSAAPPAAPPPPPANRITSAKGTRPWER